MNHKFPHQDSFEGCAYSVESCLACGFTTRRYKGGVRTFRIDGGAWKAGKMPSCPGMSGELSKESEKAPPIFDDLLTEEELDQIYGGNPKTGIVRFSSKELAKSAISPPLEVLNEEPEIQAIPYLKKSLPNKSMDTHSGIDIGDVKRFLVQLRIELKKDIEAIDRVIKILDSKTKE